MVETAAEPDGPEALRHLLSNIHPDEAGNAILIDPVVKILDDHMKDIEARRTMWRIFVRCIKVALAIVVLVFSITVLLIVTGVRRIRQLTTELLS